MFASPDLDRGCRNQAGNGWRVPHLCSRTGSNLMLAKQSGPMPVAGLPGLRVGMAAFGFDGAEVGQVTGVQPRLGLIEITDDAGTSVLLSVAHAGLIGPGFVVFRGTGSQLRSRQPQEAVPHDNTWR